MSHTRSRDGKIILMTSAEQEYDNCKANPDNGPRDCASEQEAAARAQAKKSGYVNKQASTIDNNIDHWSGPNNEPNAGSILGCPAALSTLKSSSCAQYGQSTYCSNLCTKVTRTCNHAAPEGKCAVKADPTGGWGMPSEKPIDSSLCKYTFNSLEKCEYATGFCELVCKNAKACNLLPMNGICKSKSAPASASSNR